MKLITLNKIHAVVTIALALFFINAGVKKFIPKPPRPVDEIQLIEVVVKEKSYRAPIGYQLTMNTMRANGFLKAIGVFQLLAALLMFVPKTRLTGLLLLLPIILNIFMLHVFLDNRMHENVETGILLGLNLLLLAFYFNRLKPVVWQEDSTSAQ